MLHLRAVCPAARTDAVVDGLLAHAGVANVTVLRGVAVRPSGDVVEGEVAREAADEVIALLTDQGLDRAGSVTFTELDTVLSDAADEAEQRAHGDPADAVIWQELLGRTGEESRASATFLAFLTIACLLAAVGVVTDSSVTIVGAMVVGPEFGALAAIAVGAVLGRWDLVRRAAAALAIGFPVAMLVTAGLTILGRLTGLFDGDVLEGRHEVDFVYQVGVYSWIVALLAGAAGMLAMTSEKSAALVGVFISVTTIPAAGYAVVAAVLGDWGRFAGSLGQLAVNLVGIVVAAGLVLVWRRRTGAHLPVPARPLPRG